jgi:TolA-binding protein
MNHTPRLQGRARSRLRGGLDWAALLLLACLAAPMLVAATEEEERAYQALAKGFTDGLYELVEKNTVEFTKQFPQSEHLPEAILLQGQARLRLKRYDDAAALLDEKAAAAGKLADEYRFWQAEARFEKGDLAGAADGFAKVVAEFPSSVRRLEAAYDEAFVRFTLGDAARTAGLLQDANGPFQQTAKAQPDNPWVLRGWLLLGEALVLAKDNKGAETALNQLAGRALQPEAQWRWHFLLARLQWTDQRWADALSHASNLWTAATNSVRPELLAEAATVHAETLEKLQQPEAALAAYERNLADGLPPALRRRALQKMIEISLSLNKTREVSQRLEAVIQQHPQDELLDLARLTLGELRLKEFYSVRAATTPAGADRPMVLSNLLAQARTQLELVVTNFPQSALLGKAQLDRGWVLWEEGARRYPESLLAFKSATERLPVSIDQATAQFKWADCQFQLTDYGGAISNYWLVVTNYPGLSEVTNRFTTQALYQIVCAGIAGNDLSSASAALARLLAHDPTSEWAARSELLVGQAFSRQEKASAARAVFVDFGQRFTNSAMLPEVKLALARTFELERNWPAALAEYSAWLTAYTNQATVPPGLIAQAAFDQARLAYQTKPDTNSLALLSAFVGRFPESTNAPLAQYFIGEYHFGQADYERAELHFQDKLLFQHPNALIDGLAYQARLMAARAAFAGQRYRSVRDYAGWLITNGPLSVASSPIPVPIVAQAYIFLGDSFIAESPQGATNKLAGFGEAITAFLKIVENLATNEFVPVAWGRIGDCHRQLAALEPAQAVKRCENAAEAYRKATAPAADVTTRSLAEIGLGLVLQTLASLRPPAEQGPLLDQALGHFVRVFYRTNLREGEQPDSDCVMKAGLAAAELAEQLKKWEQAVNLYRRLQTELPPLHDRLVKKIEQAAQAAAQAKAGGGK